MQAFILAAGQSTRLLPLTSDKHKCLLEVKPGLTILDVELSALRQNDITDIVISVGYFADEIRGHIKKKHPDLQVTYVMNENYAQTNCIYSAWLAKEHINEDVLFLTGDLVFGSNVIQTMLSAPGESVMYVNPTAPPSRKDFNARIKNNYIMEIGVGITGDDVRFCWPLYRLSKQSWQRWVSQMDKHIMSDNKNVYAEVAFNEIADKINIAPHYTENYCMEIDNAEDLQVVNQQFKKNLSLFL